MVTKLLDGPEVDREALSESLSSTLAERDLGLLTQIEYEGKLADIALSLGRSTVIEETWLRGGGTRFIVRNSPTGDSMECFEYRRDWRPDR